MRVHDLAHQGEADPTAGRFGGEEWPEDRLALPLRHAGAVVGDRHREPLDHRGGLQHYAARIRIDDLRGILEQRP